MVFAQFISWRHLQKCPGQEGGHHPRRRPRSWRLPSCWISPSSFRGPRTAGDQPAW